MRKEDNWSDGLLRRAGGARGPSGITTTAMLLNRLNVHGEDVFGSEWDDDEMYFEPFYDCEGAMHLLVGLVQAEII